MEKGNVQCTGVIDCPWGTNSLLGTSAIGTTSMCPTTCHVKRILMVPRPPFHYLRAFGNEPPQEWLESPIYVQWLDGSCPHRYVQYLCRLTSGNLTPLSPNSCVRCCKVGHAISTMESTQPSPMQNYSKGFNGVAQNGNYEYYGYVCGRVFPAAT